MIQLYNYYKHLDNREMSKNDYLPLLSFAEHFSPLALIENSVKSSS